MPLGRSFLVGALTVPLTIWVISAYVALRAAEDPYAVIKGLVCALVYVVLSGLAVRRWYVLVPDDETEGT